MGLEEKDIRFLFWNINRKNLTKEVLDIYRLFDIDVIALCEKDNIDLNREETLIEYELQKKTIIDGENDILILTNDKHKLNVIREEEHISVCKIYLEDITILFFVVHLPSGMYLEECARNDALISLSKDIERIEDEYLNGEHNSIVAGDFNLQPYAHGVVSVYGLNATMSKVRAMEEYRIADKRKRLYFYNPMWSLMGKDKDVQGTYYSDTDSKKESVFWYTWDQVLIRPQLISKFQNNELKILDGFGNISLLKNSKIDKKRYSDHLPIIFEIV